MKNNAGFQTIAVSSIHESTTNPRSIFDERKLAELAASLRTQGLIRPTPFVPTVTDTRSGFKCSKNNQSGHISGI